MKTPQWLDRNEYPFKSIFFSYNNVQQHYIDEGTGETILFVHGTPSWSFDFRNIIKKLAKQYRCIAIDHIGFGLSDKPSDIHYSTQYHSERLTAFIKELNLKNLHLVVHDFGGPIAINYAIQNNANVRSLTIINSWLWSSVGDPDFEKLKPVLKSPLLPFLYKYLNFSARFILPGAFGNKPLKRALRKQYTSPFQKPADRLGTIAFAKSLLNDQDWFDFLWKQIHQLKHKPVLIIWGMKDPALKPKQLEKFTIAFPNACTIKLEGCGHFPQEEEPEAVSAAIQNFLKHSVR